MSFRNDQVALRARVETLSAQVSVLSRDNARLARELREARQALRRAGLGRPDPMGEIAILGGTGAWAGVVIGLAGFLVTGSPLVVVVAGVLGGLGVPLAVAARRAWEPRR